MIVPTPLLWICGFVAATVFAVMIHSIATFRRGSGGQPSLGQPTALAEILWAIVPIFIMVSTALPAVRMLASQHATSTVQALNDP
jgi:heme/copper-type cytochrome/quinol oxidase subunit 2